MLKNSFEKKSIGPIRKKLSVLNFSNLTLDVQKVSAFCSNIQEIIGPCYSSIYK